MENTMLAWRPGRPVGSERYCANLCMTITAREAEDLEAGAAMEGFASLSEFVRVKGLIPFCYRLRGQALPGEQVGAEHRRTRERRNVGVRISVTETEKALLKDLAAQQGFPSLSAFLHDRVIKRLCAQARSGRADSAGQLLADSAGHAPAR